MLRSIAFALAMLAQEAPKTDAPKPQDPKPEIATPETPSAPAKPQLVYQGKPLVLPFSCGEAEINAFGLTCTTEEPCDVYLELAGIERVGNKVFLSGNLHTSSVTLWSILLVSEDSGRTWTEAIDRMRSTGFEQIQFIDLEVGWIGGQQLLSLPRDPFLLLTNDGGKTWRRRPLSSEPRVGAIEQFNFESRTTGALLVDRTQSGGSGGRHEFYESNTGGDSWTLRQVSPKPIPLKRPRVPNTDWRLRPDGATQSYRVEQRVSDKWQTIASFLVKVGECKSEEMKLKEPPPPTETEEAKTTPDPPARTVTGPRRPPSLKKKK